MSATVDTRQETAGRPPRISSRRLTERVFRIRESGIIVVLIVFVAITVSIEPRFASQQEVQFILANTTIFALLALGETMVIVSRNVDLSIGSVLGLSAYVSASLFGKIHGIPILVVFLVGPRHRAGCGVANGLMVSIGRVPSLVVTLATLYIVRGIDILIVGGNEVVAQTLPNAFIQIPRARRLGVPYLAIVIAAVIGVGRVLPAVLPVRAGAVRDRIQPGGGAAGRHPGRQAGLHRVRRERGDRRGGRGALGGPVPDRRLQRRHRLRAAR